jgi:Secretion system C-terminal sorting domain/Ig-like domain CHU_C associated
VIDSVSIHWPSGANDVVRNPLADQYIKVQEGGCVVPQIKLAVSGNTTFCAGDSVILTAPPGFSYLWNLGDTTQSIVATQQTTYFVQVSTPEGCKVTSDKISVIVNPFEATTINIVGDSVICAGETVTLSALPSIAYVWNTGEVTQSITVSNSGSYSVTIQGVCQLITAPAVNINVLNPSLPIANGGTTWIGGTVDLTATGNVLHWYDAATGGNEVFVGTTYQTPPLASTTTYWVENRLVDDLPNAFVGMVNHSGSQYGGLQYNGQVVFDCYQAVKLNKVKVYADIAATRRIVLKDANGVELQAKSFNIPVGITTLNLNFDIPVGQNLILTTDETVNMTNLTTTSPQLRRSDSGVSYPYTIANVISLKNSNLGSDRFYYFFKWEIDYYGKECESGRIAVDAVVDTSLTGNKELSFDFKGTISPNPTSGLVEITFSEKNQNEVLFQLYDVQGKQLPIQVERNNTNVKVDLSAFPSGIYMLLMTENQRVMRQKIVKN